VSNGGVVVPAPGSNVGITVEQSNNAPAFEATSGTGGAFYNANQATNALIMNSVGTDFGGVANTASQLWSLGHSAAIGTLITADITWGVGAVYMPGAGTTASAANAFLNSASSPVNQLLRSTSSLRYKTNVQSIQPTDINAVLQMRPVTYTSLASADNPTTVHLGFIAEEMALIDPRLVQYTPGQIQNGAPVANAPLVPDSVQYDRVVTLLVGAVQTLAQRVAALETLTAAVTPPATPATPPTLSVASTYNLTGTNVVTTPSVITTLPSTPTAS
jgi:hypothetical protein